MLIVQSILVAVLTLLLWVLVIPTSWHTALRKYLYHQISRVKLSRSTVTKPSSSRSDESAELRDRVARLEADLRAKEEPPARPPKA